MVHTNYTIIILRISSVHGIKVLAVSLFKSLPAPTTCRKYTRIRVCYTRAARCLYKYTLKSINTNILITTCQVVHTRETFVSTTDGPYTRVRFLLDALAGRAHRPSRGFTGRGWLMILSDRCLYRRPTRENVVINIRPYE